MRNACFSHFKNCASFFMKNKKYRIVAVYLYEQKFDNYLYDSVSPRHYDNWAVYISTSRTVDKELGART